MRTILALLLSITIASAASVPARAMDPITGSLIIGAISAGAKMLTAGMRGNNHHGCNQDYGYGGYGYNQGYGCRQPNRGYYARGGGSSYSYNSYRRTYRSAGPVVSRGYGGPPPQVYGSMLPLRAPRLMNGPSEPAIGVVQYSGLPCQRNEGTEGRDGTLNGRRGCFLR